MKENGYFLSHLFGSKESILTSFLQFQYQLFFIKDNFWYQKLKKFKQKDEEHLNWLAKFLIQEGEMPIYADRLYGSVCIGMAMMFTTILIKNNDRSGYYFKKENDSKYRDGHLCDRR